MVGTTSLAIVVAVLCSNPVENLTKDRVDLIEVNHFHDEQGRLVFDQIIFYDWSAKQARYNVRAWRLLKKPAQVPHRNWRGGGFVAVWHDSGLLRRVQASAMRESWTQYDPELVERQFLPKEKRRDLTKLIIKRAPEGR